MVPFTRLCATGSALEFRMTSRFFNQAVVVTMPLVPRPLIWRFSQRYIAGTSLEDAYRTVRELNSAHCTATIDVLGEDSTSSS